MLVYRYINNMIVMVAHGFIGQSEIFEVKRSKRESGPLALFAWMENTFQLLFVASIKYRNLVFQS